MNSMEENITEALIGGHITTEETIYLFRMLVNGDTSFIQVMGALEERTHQAYLKVAAEIHKVKNG